jgi:uncharacterized protein with ParB-like and HNH nuclease domain
VALTAEDRFKAESLNITELFQTATYEVPAFQRDYSWTKEQCEDLWGDIENLVEGRVKAHFIGPMVVIRRKESKELSRYRWPATPYNYPDDDFLTT